VDDELVAMMKKRGTFYVATLNVDASFSAFADDPALLDDPFLTAALPPDSVQQFRSPEYRAKVAADPNVPKARAALENGMRNLKTLHARGVHIAFGTDSGANPVRIQGWGEHRELELMVKAGLSPMDALVAATRGSATMLGISDRGTLERANGLIFSCLPGTRSTTSGTRASSFPSGTTEGRSSRSLRRRRRGDRAGSVAPRLRFASRQV